MTRRQAAGLALAAAGAAAGYALMRAAIVHLERQLDHALTVGPGPWRWEPAR